MGKNNSKRSHMAYCVVKENISARTCPNERMNKVFIPVKNKICTAATFLIMRRSLES